MTQYSSFNLNSNKSDDEVALSHVVIRKMELPMLAVAINLGRRC